VGQGIDTTLVSDADGDFEGWIAVPPGNRLAVRVSSLYPRFSRWIELAGVEAVDGVIELDLELENHAIEGTVVDREGEPLRRAKVVVMGGDGRAVETLSEVDGRFLATGLTSGRHRVWATLRGYGASRALSIQVSEDRRHGEIRLTVSPGDVRRGRLLAANGATVGGARVKLSVPGEPGWVTSVSSGADGTFEVKAPADSQRLVATVTAPAAGVLWSTCVELAGETFQITLPPGSGSIVVSTVDGTPLPDFVLVSSDGGALSKDELLRWASRRGGPVTPSEVKIPHVATGFYALSSGAARTAGCRSGSISLPWRQLAPGGELDFRDTGR
ncbi:MAG: carboxypeptidase-like regulatory domain-containing protein, partial [Acidobacteriota bacterium]